MLYNKTTKEKLGKANKILVYSFWIYNKTGGLIKKKQTKEKEYAGESDRSDRSNRDGISCKLQKIAEGKTVMWTRYDLKMNAKMAFKRNYWTCVAASLVVGVFEWKYVCRFRKRCADYAGGTA